MNIADVLIVGAGPGGLTAATYLRRFHRTTIVMDSGDSRARWIPKSHNIPGFPQGIVGTEFLGQLRAQALKFGADIHQRRVDLITPDDDLFLVRAQDETCAARYVLLATGVIDRLPALQGVEAAVLRSLLRICPICDAFEATGHSIAVIGDSEHAEREAEFLCTYSDRVTLIHVGKEPEPAADQRLRSRGIQIIATGLENLRIEQQALVLHRPGDSPVKFDVCYSALGCLPQNQLATQLGARRDAAGALLVNRHQETSVARLYAAGDMVRGLNQVVVAAAEAAVAATDIHNQLGRCS